MLLTGSMKAAIDLFAGLQEGRYQPLSETVREINISHNYAEQMLAAGRHQGIVKSLKGPGGGYALAIPFKDITLGQILEVIDAINKRVRKPFVTPTGEQVNQALYAELRDRPLSDFLAHQ